MNIFDETGENDMRKGRERERGIKMGGEASKRAGWTANKQEERNGHKIELI